LNPAAEHAASAAPSAAPTLYSETRGHDTRGTEPLVLLHGWGMNLRVFDPLADALATRYRVTAIDLPGHGRSPWTASLAAPQWLAGIASLLPRAATLVGWSLGGQLALIRTPGRERVLRRGQTLLVPDGPQSGVALERWYRRMARREIGERLDRACALAGLEYTRLTIRDQRTRWGSCSRNGAMSFNWRLLLAPSEVLDYVVWHEVCHLEVMDHSPRFWALVARHCPEHAKRAAWLRHNAATLVL